MPSTYWTCGPGQEPEIPRYWNSVQNPSNAFEVDRPDIERMSTDQLFGIPHRSPISDKAKQQDGVVVRTPGEAGFLAMRNKPASVPIYRRQLPRTSYSRGSAKTRVPGTHRQAGPGVARPNSLKHLRDRKYSVRRAIGPAPSIKLVLSGNSSSASSAECTANTSPASKGNQ